MERTRIKLAVFVDLDPVPGAFNTSEDVQSRIQNMLDHSIPHYNPKIDIESADIVKDHIFEPLG